MVLGNKIFVLNYKQELSEEIFEKIKGKFDTYVLNENKWYNFAFKLLKILNSYERVSIVVHWWLAWWEDNSYLWNVYQIQRSFLYNEENMILESQKHRFSDSFNFFENSNIVTKFKIWKHSDIIYDFAPIFDIETFWIWSITNLFSFPILTFKWVSDINESVFYALSEEEEIDFLLNPNMKRKKKEIILNKLKDIINNLSYNLLKWVIDKL